MANIGLLQYAPFLGANTVSGMAQKVGLTWPPPPPVSVRNLIQLAGEGVAARSDVVKAPWAVLLCKFTDDLSEPYPRSFYEDLFTTSGAGSLKMVDFFRDASQRKLDVSGSNVFGWYTLDHSRFDYTGRDSPLIDWAKQKASDQGADLGSYSFVVVCMNVPTDLFGGTSGVVCDSGVFQNGNCSLSPGIVGQEMGHGYGLAHSRADLVANSPFGSNGPPDFDYADAWDIMSTQSAYMAPHPNMPDKDDRGLAMKFVIGPMLNAANMDSQKWLSESRVWKAAGSFDETITLRPLANPNLPGWLAARIREYLVEFRVQEGWDANIPRPAVLVHRFQDNHSYIMSGTKGNQDLIAGDVCQVGDPSSGSPWVKVEVVNIDPARDTATVRLESG